MVKKAVEVPVQVTDANKTKQKVKGISGAFGSLFSKIKSILSPARLLTVAILAIGAGMVKLVGIFASLETKMVNVGNLFGASRKEVNKLTKDLLELGTKTPQKVDDLALSLFDVVSAGVPAAESIEFLGVAANLATAGVTTTTIAVDGLTSALNAYSMDAKEAESVSDKFFAAQQEGKTTIAELAQTIGTVAPLAANAGISLDELLASTAALTKQGIKTNTAVIGLRGAITSIIKPTEEAQEIAKLLGIEFSSVALDKKGLVGFLKDVEAKTGGNTEAMGKLFGNVRALNAVLALSKGRFKDVDKAMKEVQNSAGRTKKANEEVTNTMNAQWQMFKNNLIQIGEFIFGWIPEVITGILSWFNMMFDGIKTGFNTLKKGITTIFNFITRKEEESADQSGKTEEDKTKKKKKELEARLLAEREALRKEIQAKLDNAAKEADLEAKRLQALKDYQAAAEEVSAAVASGQESALKTYGNFLKKQLVQQVNAFFSAEQAKLAAIAIANWWNPVGWAAAGQIALLEGSKQVGMAAVNSIKFADGGIVPGNQVSGDNVIARVNSGEMVLNRQQQRNLFNVANTGVEDLVGGEAGGGGGGGIAIILDSDGHTMLAKGIYQKTTDMLQTGELQERR